MSVQIDLTSSFERSVRRLARKYPRAPADLEAVIAALIARPTLGTAIPGCPEVRKVRVRSTDMGRGKSGGFRLLYVWDEEKSIIHVLLAYAKSEREDVTLAELANLLAEVAPPSPASPTDESAEPLDSGNSQ